MHPVSPQRTSRFSRVTLQNPPSLLSTPPRWTPIVPTHESTPSLVPLSGSSPRHNHRKQSRRPWWSTRRAVLFLFAVAMSFTVWNMARITSSRLHHFRHADEDHAPLVTTLTNTTSAQPQPQPQHVPLAALPVAHHAYTTSSNDTKSNPSPPWPTSTNKLPDWIKNYFAWHGQQRALLTARNWNATGTPKFLVMTALSGKKSGGMTDRLRPLPAMVRIAARSKRILLIYWERPCALQHFLMPPKHSGGLDWRVPDYMRHAVSNTRPVAHLKRLDQNAGQPDSPRIFTTIYQSWNYGELWYDEQLERGELPVRDIFREIWHAVFVPSPPVQARIDANLQQMQLTPGEFATAHLRVTYGKDDGRRNQDKLQDIVENAMNCVSNLRPGGPFFVASDSPTAVALAKQYGASKGVHVASAAHPHAPIHVDFHNESDTSLGPSSFYDGFVDLYLLAATRCTAVGPGGFARWGDLLGFGDKHCVIHHHGRKAQTCPWKDKLNVGNSAVVPATPSPNTNLPAAVISNKPARELVEEDATAVVDISAIEQHFPHNLPNNHNNIWEESNLIPQWLKDYFAWHQEQRAIINATNWQSHRYLIMVAKKGQHNGGMTDRIRPLPAFLRIAANAKRIFMIHWERPFPLEEFLLPPRGGLDWRVPAYMKHAVIEAKPRTNFEPILAVAPQPKPHILTTVYQSWNYGELYYKEQQKPGETDIYTAFRDIWNVVFTPSPPVSGRIHANFERMGIVPGEFATAHMRVLYKVLDRPPEEIEPIVHNAMNCASSLRPGGPYFVASDSLVAIQMAIDYGRSRNVTVVAATHERQPLHVDFHNESDASVTPGDFYDGFVDMYLMAATRCVAVGPGGFARWGNLLGYEASCVKHHNGRKAQTCEWTWKPNNHDARQYPQQIPAFRPPMTETSSVY